MPKSRFLTVANMSLNAISENFQIYSTFRGVENFTCLKEQISLYLSVLKRFTLENNMKPIISSCRQYGS